MSRVVVNDMTVIIILLLMEQNRTVVIDSLISMIGDADTMAAACVWTKSHRSQFWTIPSPSDIWKISSFDQYDAVVDCDAIDLGNNNNILIALSIFSNEAYMLLFSFIYIVYFHSLLFFHCLPLFFIEFHFIHSKYYNRMELVPPDTYDNLFVCGQTRQWRMKNTKATTIKSTIVSQSIDMCLHISYGNGNIVFAFYRLRQTL